MIATAIPPLGSAILDLSMLAQVSDEVERVEEELRRQVASQVHLVEQVGRVTLEAGGKRLRPAFVALAAKAIRSDVDEDRVVRLGACMETIHMATLVHDDVIDGSPTRRGRATAAAEFGNTAAILGGDVLLAKAMVLLARDGDLQIIRTVSEAVVEMAEGEVRELEVRGDFDLDEDSHIGVLRLKTASFIEACCEVGGRVAGATDAQIQALRAYGYHLGIAFQIVDDLLDYRGDRAQTGKTLGTDFRDGQATLPLIYLRETMSEAEATIARRRFGNGVSDDELRMIADWMATRGAFDRAEALARTHVNLAVDALTILPESLTRTVLSTVAEYVLMRSR